VKSAAMTIRRTFTLIVAVVLLGPSHLARTQEKPNFSGVWTRIPGSPQGSSPDSGFMSQDWAMGQPVTITQDASSITIAYVSNGRSHSRMLLTYKLDGSATKNSAALSSTVQTLASTAAWDEGSLVLITVAEVPDRTSGTTGGVVRYDYRDRLTLESSTTFRLESSLTVRGNKAARTARFQRTEPPRLSSVR
jgi:hypothetical protein